LLNWTKLIIPVLRCSKSIWFVNEVFNAALEECFNSVLEFVSLQIIWETHDVRIQYDQDKWWDKSPCYFLHRIEWPSIRHWRNYSINFKT
jgi:hypothetical protein